MEAILNMNADRQQTLAAQAPLSRCGCPQPQARLALLSALEDGVRSWLLLPFLLGVLVSGCSLKRMAVNQLGNALASGGSTFASDEDPELVKAALPFSLKLMESLLAESPKHQGLLFAASSGFTQYAYAFVQEEADEMEDKDLAAAMEMRVRAEQLYLRARNYGLRGLEARHHGFEKALRENSKVALRTATPGDVPLLYWTGVSWAAAISLAKDQPELIAELPLVEALIDRSLELDESFDHGAIHSFLVAFEMGRTGGTESPEARARRHFDRALELSGGHQAGLLVSMAESVSVQKQDVAGFKELLERALAIHSEDSPEWRLANLVAQRRARWLLGRTDQLFLAREPGEKAPP